MLPNQVFLFYSCNQQHETNKPFCSGLYKIQTKKEETMNARERTACKWLLKQNTPAYQIEQITDNTDDRSEESLPNPSDLNDFSMGLLLDDTMEEAQRQLDEANSEYCNTDHFISSAAIVECLWSKFDALVPQRREGMSPVLIEAIIFLKENRDLWSIKDIPEAIRRVKDNEKEKRTQKRLEAHEEEEDQIARDAALIGVQETIAPVVYNGNNTD